MFSRREDSRSAILFLAPEGVVKELLYSEFEALLEGFTPEKDWAGRDAKAVYLELAADLSAKAAVFFTLAFDNEGWVEASWNLPLVNLARTAKVAPDCAWPMRVATARNCPNPAYQSALWNPDLTPKSKVLAWIADALAVNRLGFTKLSSPEAQGEYAHEAASASAAPVSSSLEQQVAQLVQQQMFGSSQVAEALAQLDKTKAEYEAKVAALKVDLNDKVRKVEAVELELKSLTDNLTLRDRKLAEMREFYELKLEKTKGSDADYIRALREHFEKETAERIASAESEYKELLNWREVELMYRAEREAALQSELQQLRRENADLKEAENQGLLKALVDKGITFTSFQLGLGHIAIALEDIPLYLANPVGFVAAYCNTTESHYLDWLAHYHAPVCRVLDKGEPCGTPIERVDSPEHFKPGASDCCERHRKA